MNCRNSNYAKVALMVYILIRASYNRQIHKLGLSYGINPNSIDYKAGLLRVIGVTEEYVQVGAKSTIFKVPFDPHSPIKIFLSWEVNTDHYCSGGNSMYIKYISEDKTKNVMEVCGSDSCQLECRTYDLQNKILTDRHNGYRMIPIEVELSSKYILIDKNVMVAVPTDKSHAYIALHFNRSVYHSFNTPMLTPHLSFSYDKVDFLQLLRFKDKVYFIFTETASEMINYHNTFFHTLKPKLIFTRLGRICINDQGIQLSELFFTTFFKTSFSCKLLLERARFTKQYIEYNHAVAASTAHGKSGIFFILFRSAQPTGADFMYSSVFCQYNLIHIEKQLENSKLAVLKQTDSTKYWSQDMKKHNLSQCRSSFGHLAPNTEWMVTNYLQPSSHPYIVNSNKSIGNPTSFEMLKSLPLQLIMPNNETYSTTVDMIYIGTDKGIVAKSVLLDRALIKQLKLKLFHKESVLKFDHIIEVFERNVKVNEIKINSNKHSLVVVSDSIVKRIPLEFCSNDCWSCNSNLDPMCQWNPKTKICEAVSFSRKRQIVRIYNCQLDQAFQSRNLIKEKPFDMFWLIFSLVTFFSIFTVVLTVSIAIRYSPVSFPQSTRSNRSTVYEIIQNKAIESSIKKPKICHNSITSSFSESSSSNRQRFKLTFPNKKSKSFNSTKDSLVYENKFYMTAGRMKYYSDKTKPCSIRGLKRMRTNYCAITKETSHLTSWKSCEAVFQMSRRP